MKKLFGLQNLELISKQPAKLEHLLDKLSDHPVVQGMVKEEEDKAVAARLAEGEKIKQLLAGHDRERAKLEAEFIAADRELKKIEPGYSKTAARWRDARDAMFHHDHNCAVERDRAFHALERSASPVIDQYINRLYAMHDELVQSQMRQVFSHSVWTHDRTKKVDVWRTDVNSRIKRMKAILEARDTMLQIKLEADHTNLIPRLEKLIADLPSVDLETLETPGDVKNNHGDAE